MSESSPDTTDQQFEQALAAIDGDTDLFGKLAEAFEEEAQTLSDRLNDGMQTDDLPKVRRAAHSLMGPLQLFAATNLTSTAKTLEAACQNEQAESAAELVQQLTVGVRELQQALRSYVQKNQSQWSQ